MWTEADSIIMKIWLTQQKNFICAYYRKRFQMYLNTGGLNFIEGQKEFGQPAKNITSGMWTGWKYLLRALWQAMKSRSLQTDKRQRALIQISYDFEIWTIIMTNYPSMKIVVAESPVEIFI